MICLLLCLLPLYSSTFLSFRIYINMLVGRISNLLTLMNTHTHTHTGFSFVWYHSQKDGPDSLAINTIMLALAGSLSSSHQLPWHLGYGPMAVFFFSRNYVVLDNIWIMNVIFYILFHGSVCFYYQKIIMSSFLLKKHKLLAALF